MIKQFQFVDGMIDLYIVFYEIGINLLNDKGKLGYAVYVIHTYCNKELTEEYCGKHTDKKKIVYFKDKSGNIKEIESTILHRCIKPS